MTARGSSSGELARPGRALAIGAHPDDVEFGCGATLAAWSAAGTHCEILVLTDGSKGTWDARADTAELVATRQREQRDAAAALGVAAVRFGPAVDGELEVDRAMREHVCSVIRAVRPDVVLGHDPWKRYRLHPDHRAAGQLVIDGIVAARDPHFFPDTGTPHRPDALLLFEAEVVDHFEPVNDTAFDTKVRALLAHHSQWRSTMGIDPDATSADALAQQDAFHARVRERLDVAPDGRPAEGFKLIAEL